MMGSDLQPVVRLIGGVTPRFWPEMKTVSLWSRSVRVSVSHQSHDGP